MTVSDDGGGVTVDLECTRTTDGGLIIIGGEVTDSTHPWALEGTIAAIVLQRGSPVKSVFFFEEASTAPATCLVYLEGVVDAEAAPGLESIRGTLELRP